MAVSPAPPALNVVAATRLEGKAFWEQAALGLSLRRLSDPRIVPRVAPGNARPLPEIYNAAIDLPEGPDLVAFVHDDVWIDDYFFVERITEALERFDIVGVAGSRTRREGQRAWCFIEEASRRDNTANLSGRVAQGPRPFGQVFYFGTTPAECELLDGVLLAARRSVLRERGVRFDPAFAFHGYDLDFCRSARAAGLRLGTWPVCVTHQSIGGFEGTAYRDAVSRYLAKWGG
jgi:GT2 family glycosyltransferase